MLMMSNFCSWLSVISPSGNQPLEFPPRAEALLARAKASKILRSLRNEIGE